jgi:hypothetical protein
MEVLAVVLEMAVVYPPLHKEAMEVETHTVMGMVSEEGYSSEIWGN